MRRIVAVLCFLPAIILSTGCTCPHARSSGGLASRSPRVEFSLITVAFSIGGSKVHAQERRFGTNSITLVNLHDDEQASVEAGRVVLEKHGGRLIELVHSGKRRVVFSLNGKEYSFDPNRIFSPAGIRLTVRGEGNIPEEAYQAVQRFADEFLRYFRLDRQRQLITLHNNGEGDFSINSYRPGAEFEADTAQLYVNPDGDPDDFYFVTEEPTFQELRKRKFNVVLQDNRIRRDDGSLSVYAGRHSIAYANVEAEPQHLGEQIRMVEIAVQLLESR
jgi:hypothetical protein